MSLVFFSACVFADKNTGVRFTSQTESSFSRAALADAFNAYKAADYSSATILFRRALTDPQNQSDSTLYMLIMAEFYSGDYRAVYADTEYFLQTYPDSSYAPLIKYQRGRDLFYLGQYDEAVLVLSDFCHQNPSSEMYASALFWIGECFYSGYNFAQAKPLYERIVNDFPKDAKAVEAKYRLDSINQRTREEKLLYLLQQTGESYLSSKENYEKALRRYELENRLGVQEKFLRGQSPLTEEVSVESPSAEVEAAPVKDETAAMTVGNVPDSSSGENEVPAQGQYNFLDALRRLKDSAAEAQVLLKEDDKK